MDSTQLCFIRTFLLIQMMFLLQSHLGEKVLLYALKQLTVILAVNKFKSNILTFIILIKSKNNYS